MKRLLSIIMLSILLCASGMAQTTPNLQLNIPPTGTPNWGPLINNNFIALDLLLSGNQQLPVISTLQGYWINGVTVIDGSMNATFNNITINGTCTGAGCGTGGGGAVFTPNALQWATSTTASRAGTSADIGTLGNLSNNTTGNAANVTGLIAVSHGGTGTSTPGLIAGPNVSITGTWPNNTISASLTGGGNVSNSGTPTVHQTPVWVDATHISGVGPGTTGMVWTSNGASADPSWQTPSGTGGGITWNGAATATAFATAFDSTHAQTPSATSTLDSSGNAIFAGSVSAGAGAATAGGFAYAQGTDNGLLANTISVQAPTTVQATGYSLTLPGTEPTTGQILSVTSIAGHKAVYAWSTGTSSSTRTWSYTFSGVCQAGVASTPIFIPQANGWGISSCGSPATPYTSEWYLDAGNTAEAFTVRLLVPAGHTGNYTLTMQYRSVDTSAHAATIQPSYGCLAAGAVPESMTFTNLGSAITLTPAATTQQMVYQTVTGLNPTCGDGNDLYITFTATSPNSLTSSLNMSLLSLTVQGNQ